MRCTLIERQLSDYLDGVLSPPVAREIERHLRRCRTCAGELEALRRTVALVQDAEEAEFIPQTRLESLQTQLLKTLEHQSQGNWLNRGVARFRFWLRCWKASWVDLLDAGGWGRRFQAGALVLLLMVGAVWVDRHYFRPTLPEMIRQALVSDVSLPPTTVIGARQAKTPRALRLSNRETEVKRTQRTLDNLAYRLIAPLPLQRPEGMAVRAVELKDGKLLFIGTLDVVGLTEVPAQDPPLRDVEMPMQNPTVVMLPRHFEEPAAPIRGDGKYLFADLLEEWTYPVASPPGLVLDGAPAKQR